MTPPGPCGHELLDEGLRREKGALQVVFEHQIEVRLGDLPERGVLLEPRIVHEDVELAKLRKALRDERFTSATWPRSAWMATLACPREDLRRHRRRPPGAMVIDDDFGAFLREANRNGRPCPGCCR